MAPVYGMTASSSSRRGIRWIASFALATIAAVFVAATAGAADGDLVWARHLGGASVDVGYGVAVDESGNVYTTGSFQGTADFDPGAGTFNLTSAGGSDVFVLKVDAAGDLVWARQLGGPSDDFGTGVAVDGSGNVHTSGRFAGTADFDPGAGTFNLTVGGDDGFVSKLDAAGDLVWARQLGGTSGDIANGVAVDASGIVYTTGHFNGTADFDPGAGTFNLTSAGSSDVFVSKLDAAGDLVWARQLGGAGALDVGNGVAVDGSGNVYTTGQFAVTGDFDPGTGTFNLTSAGSFDVFVSKLDAAGDLVWARQLGGTSGDVGNEVAVDGSGNVYTTGRFLATADFDPGAGTFNLTPAGSNDVFVSKLDAAGDLAWARQLGGGSGDVGNGVAVDGVGNVYTTGDFLGTADFDPGAGTSNLISAGSNEVFVSKLDSAGEHVWAAQLGGSEGDGGVGVAVDGFGNVHVVGYFSTTGDFDPGAATLNLTSVGSNDAFVVRLEGSDLTDPVVIPPSDVVEEATGPSGAVVTFGSGSATDNVGVTAGPTCLPASGSVFPIDVTTVTCTASDAEGNEGEATFTVTVEDTTDPVVTPPGDVLVEAAGSGGAVVGFGSGSASDVVGVVSAPTCLPPSGSFFAMGLTVVTCSASDAAGNEGEATFNVTVTAPLCRGQAVTILGTSAGEVINGTSGNDVIRAFGGDDTIHGNGGDDTICGGQGTDVIYGGAGKDRLLGGAGNDMIFGGADNDNLHGRPGEDTMYGGAGNDKLRGDTGNDTMVGGTGNDNLNGGFDIDTCDGETELNCEL